MLEGKRERIKGRRAARPKTVLQNRNPGLRIKLEFLFLPGVHVTPCTYVPRTYVHGTYKCLVLSDCEVSVSLFLSTLSFFLSFFPLFLQQVKICPVRACPFFPVDSNAMRQGKRIRSKERKKEGEKKKQDEEKTISIPGRGRYRRTYARIYVPIIGTI